MPTPLFRRLHSAVWVGLCAIPLPAGAAFPSQLYPPAPFPIVTAQSYRANILANGVSYAHYTLITTSGPLSVNAVLVDTHDPATRLRTVLANDRLVSPGETVSSMASRTGAIAGINGDYYARGGTNEPLDLVINNGTIVRSPGRRVALAVHENGAISIGPYSWRGTATWREGSVMVTAVDAWPPDGGASLLLPTYGAPTPRAGVTFASLAPIMSTAEGTTYRVTAETDGGAPPNTLGLAMGPAAIAQATPPEIGETLLLSGSLVPPANDIVTAIGGGPALLTNGDYTPLLDLPENDEAPSRLLPLSGAGKTNDGSLLLLEVDGRQPAFSIGLTRQAFAALMSAFDGSDALCFDSGGSSTLVAQLPGEPAAMLRNHPSDGRERRVADGLFVYSAARARVPVYHSPQGENPDL
jgi:exopolysaccharide biosynthesis protein